MGEVDVEDHRVVDCLPHAVADDLLVVLRLDYGKWLVHMWPAELVAGLVALVDALAAAVDGDLAVGEEVILAGDMLRVSVIVALSISDTHLLKVGLEKMRQSLCLSMRCIVLFLWYSG